ncbi:MAG: lysine biosynthesis protein LysX [Planctomycetota bacterium]|nr:lysine biosynthesis protein LysX [Planctomycetota bacterium]
MRLGILHARVRQDEKLILAELDRRGVDYELIHVEKLVFDLHARPADERWLGLDVVLERCVSHSRAMAALRILDAWGIPCVNPWWIGEVCGDKLTTNLALASAGVPVPRARVAFTPASALEAIEELGYPAVLKPAVGSWGRLLARVTDRDSAEAVLEHKATLGTYHHSIFYVQEHVEKSGYDIRSFVIGDETVCAVERHSEHWITNTARGAVTRGRKVDDALHEISVAAARAVGGGVVAVDVFETDRGLLVNEVNYTMEFKNSIEPTGVDVPAKLVDYLIEVGEGRVVVPAPRHVAARNEAVT